MDTSVSAVRSCIPSKVEVPTVDLRDREERRWLIDSTSRFVFETEESWWRTLLGSATFVLLVVAGLVFFGVMN